MEIQKINLACKVLETVTETLIDLALMLIQQARHDKIYFNSIINRFAIIIRGSNYPLKWWK